MYKYTISSNITATQHIPFYDTITIICFVIIDITKKRRIIKIIIKTVRVPISAKMQWKLLFIQASENETLTLTIKTDFFLFKLHFYIHRHFNEFFNFLFTHFFFRSVLWLSFLQFPMQSFFYIFFLLCTIYLHSNWMNAFSSGTRVVCMPIVCLCIPCTTTSK